MRLKADLEKHAPLEDREPSPREAREADEAAARRRQRREALSELERILKSKAEAIRDRQAVLQEQGYSHKDAMTAAKIDVVRDVKPELAVILEWAASRR
jgi:hypothetical protein